jgi:predicted SAM-dependent methyltransferase
MLHQTTRDIYFALVSPVARLNHWRWRIQNVVQNGHAARYLHLGCGPKYLPGFANIDGNFLRKTDAWLDLRIGLPFASGSVDSIYSSHVFEHFYAHHLQRILRECHRVLRPGGGMRIVVPDMATAVRAYVEARPEAFTDFPRACRSLGGKLSNQLFCEGGHRQAFDFSYMQELLGEAGFSEVWDIGAHRSETYPPEVFERLQAEEVGVAWFSLFVEARKQASCHPVQQGINEREK